MLKKVKIESFKGFKHFSCDLGKLTLLTGYNAAGKSSVLQSLGLLKQTISTNEWAVALQLNGRSVALGTMNDAINRDVGGNSFSLALESDCWSCSWTATSDSRQRDMIARISKVHFKSDKLEKTWCPEDGPLHHLLPDSALQSIAKNDEYFRLGSICHIGAERLGPREVYPDSGPLVFADVGTKGEHTVQCLHQFYDSPTNPGVWLEGITAETRPMVVAWMDLMFPGFDYQIKPVDGANLLTLSLRTDENGDYFRPTNVGFGITHILPIVTACVAARPGSLILIENPESHLHPAGQSMMGAFLASAARHGVQLIVETHSDHILNGVRRAVRDQKIEGKDVSIHFFENSSSSRGEPTSCISSMKICDNGSIEGWRDGFFDQMRLDLDYIHGIK